MFYGKLMSLFNKMLEYVYAHHVHRLKYGVKSGGKKHVLHPQKFFKPSQYLRVAPQIRPSAPTTFNLFCDPWNPIPRPKLFCHTVTQVMYIH